MNKHLKKYFIKQMDVIKQKICNHSNIITIVTDNRKKEKDSRNF